MASKKMVGISIPCYNEKDNVISLCETIVKIFEEQLKEYDFVIQFIDNCSTDGTQDLLISLCKKYQGKVRAIFNVKNYGWYSGGHGLINAEGDCVLTIAADFEEPPEMIPLMVHEWAHNGFKIVAGVKTATDENIVMALMRKVYYKINCSLAEYAFIEGFSGFGLYDREFIEIYRKYQDEETVFRNFVVQYGWEIKTLPYYKKERTRGRSKHTLFSLFNDFFRTFVDGHYIGIRIITFSGIIISLLSLLIGGIYFVLKMDILSVGIAVLLIGIFFWGGIQLFALGMIGEYIIKLDLRLKPKQIIHERMRIGFEKIVANESEK